jgi:hypothetical protein
MARRSPTPRYGIAEWFGSPFASLQPFVRLQLIDSIQPEKTQAACPFQPSKPVCKKAGGVCSIRRYSPAAGDALDAVPTDAEITITCPNRFRDGLDIYRWIGGVVLGDEKAVPLSEIGFLETRAQHGHEVTSEEVGRIDSVLVLPGTSPLKWCAVETQGMYFSGANMGDEFGAIKNAGGAAVFPVGQRRPDYRSSGPKRLLPQLQIKVPTLRTWGKKTAVVVDESFLRCMGTLTTVSDLSHAEVIWFVVRVDESVTPHKLVRVKYLMSRLADSERSLNASDPVTQEVFETRIRERLMRVTGAA